MLQIRPGEMLSTMEGGEGREHPGAQAQLLGPQASAGFLLCPEVSALRSEVTSPTSGSQFPALGSHFPVSGSERNLSSPLRQKCLGN
jgi:hypothetical protein